MGQFWIFLNGAARMLVMIALVIVCINAIYSGQGFITVTGTIGLVGVIYHVYRLIRNTKGN